jgi:aerobic-type carbon monoxide dehydrogenase small subunit (CoxS/CutS family)
MAGARDSTSEELSPAAAAVVASTAHDIAKQQTLSDQLEAQIQDKIKDLKRVSCGACTVLVNSLHADASVRIL